MGSEELERHRASFDRLQDEVLRFAPTHESLLILRLSKDAGSSCSWMMIAALAVSLSACGKKGAPEPPDPQSDHFPRQYPDPSSL